jgi:hypothetical protein
MRARSAGNNVEHPVVHITPALFTMNRQEAGDKNKRAGHAKEAGSIAQSAN